MAIKKGKILPTAFDEYKLGNQIGQGGNGRVFEAINNKNERKAIKVFDKTNMPKDKIKRFKNEIFFCMHSNHKNIIKIEDYGYYKDDKNEYIFYVMPYYDETLRGRMEQNTSNNDKIEIVLNVLEGLKYAHHKKVIHRDIKPENILLNKNSNEAVIADFGIAQIMNEEDRATIVETKNNEIIGNRNYCAPEQKDKNSTIDERADIFSLGLLMNELFTGKIPSGVKYRKIGDERSEVKFLDEVVDRMITQNPSDRLYPEDKIKIELKVRMDVEKTTKEIEELKNKELKVEKADEMKTPEVIGLEFENNQLTIILSEGMPVGWGEVLKYGNFSSRVLLDYPRSSFSVRYDRVFVKIKSHHQKETIKKVVDYFKRWLPLATAEYNKQVKNEQKKSEREKEEERKQEIQKEQRNIDIKNELKNLL